MISRTIARRYATALYEAAEEHGQVDPIEAVLARTKDLLEQNALLRHMLANRRIPLQQRKDLLLQALDQFLQAGPGEGDGVPGEAPELLINFLKLLLDKQREGHIAEIYEQYRKAVLAGRNMAEALLTLAAPLSDEALEQIKTRLEKITGLSLQITVQYDPEVVGGMVVRIGDRRLDGSLKKKLREMEAAIAGGVRYDGEGVLVR